MARPECRRGKRRETKKNPLRYDRSSSGNARILENKRYEGLEKKEGQRRGKGEGIYDQTFEGKDRKAEVGVSQKVQVQIASSELPQITYSTWLGT